MTRSIPDPRTDDETAALRICLQCIVDVHDDAEGFIHVWQPREDGTNTFTREVLSDFQEKFMATPWEFVNGLPVDLYFRQQSYHVPWPRKGHPPVKELRCIFVDLDCYSLDTPIPVMQAVEGALEKVQSAGMPPPNHIDYSGDGVNGGAYFRWLIEPRAAEDGLERFRDNNLWKDTAKGITDYLAEYGADKKTCELLRWLRVPGSINAKYLEAGDGSPSFREYQHSEIVDLEALASPLGIERLSGPIPLPKPKPEFIRPPQEPVSELCDKQKRHPNQRVVYALSRLNFLRAGIKDGLRNIALFSFVAIHNGSPLSEEVVRARARNFCAEFIPPLTEEEIEKDITSGLDREHRKFSYRWLIDTFEITAEEQDMLGIKARPLIHDPEGGLIVENMTWHREDARKRATTSRRAKGVEPKAVVNARKSQAISTVKHKRFEQAYRSQQGSGKVNISQIAAEAEINWKTVKKYLTESSTSKVG